MNPYEIVKNQMDFLEKSTKDTFSEMEKRQTEEAMKDMACWEAQNHFKNCEKCRSNFPGITVRIPIKIMDETAAENLAEETAREEEDKEDNK